MKNEWNDERIAKALRALRDEPAPDPDWADRAWASIEARLSRKPSRVGNLFGEPALRWAAVAVCLLVAIGWNIRSRRGSEIELGAYVSAVSRPALVVDADEVTEPFLFSDGTGLTQASWAEDDEPHEPTVYDTMLEL